MKRIQKTEEKKNDKININQPSQNNSEFSKRGKEIKENLDKLMDKIDEVLEDNAEEFVRNFIQQGGQ